MADESRDSEELCGMTKAEAKAIIKKGRRVKRKKKLKTRR